MTIVHPTRNLYGLWLLDAAPFWQLVIHKFRKTPVVFRCSFVDFRCKKTESHRVFPWHLDAES